MSHGLFFLRPTVKIAAPLSYFSSVGVGGRMITNVRQETLVTPVSTAELSSICPFSNAPEESRGEAGPRGMAGMDFSSFDFSFFSFCLTFSRWNLCSKLIACGSKSWGNRTLLLYSQFLSIVSGLNRDGGKGDCRYASSLSSSNKY